MLLTTVRQTLYMIGRKARRRFCWLLLLAVFASCVEVFSAGMVYALLGLVTDSSADTKLPLIGSLQRLTEGGDNKSLLLGFVGAAFAFFVFRAVLQIATQYVTSRVVHGTTARLSTRLLRGYLDMPLEFHLHRDSAELIRNTQQVTIELAQSALYPMIRIGSESILVVAILVLLVLVSPLGAGLALVFIGGTSALLLRVVQPRLKRIGLRAHQLHKATLVSQQQCFEGVRDIKLLGREDSFSGVYAANRHNLARSFYLRATIGSLTPISLDSALMGFVLAFFAISIASGSFGQGMLPILGLFAYAGLRLQPSLASITSSLNNLKFASAPASDIYADLQLIEERLVSGEQVDTLRMEKEVRLRDVSFRYQGADRDALADINLTIRRGEHIGICGPTGGGKSTMMDVLLGLLAPTRGQVLVDGRDIATNIRGWQKNVGVVPQMVFLVDDTVARNIALGVADDDIDRSAILEATHLAQLDDFIASLPKGLDSVVGERGIRISGGERQRIAIARALYHRPEILVLDEGTSALDNTTEQKLMLSLERLRESHTILLIAHRLSTVRGADRVVLIQDGRISGIDNFEGLMASNESFRAMASTP